MKNPYDHNAVLRDLESGSSHIAVVGLGYVGLPLAVALSRHFSVIGLDVNREKIELYRKGIDVTDEVSDAVLRECSVRFSSDLDCLKEASVVIVAVPTPIHMDKTPDLSPLVNASHLVGSHILKGTVVVFESTVYPGVTEDVCAPAIEKASGLVCGEDFYIGYSPERVNPGDRSHTVETITKIVSAAQPPVLDLLAAIYGSVTGGNIHRAGSIRVAEAAKLLENSQRDVNIAFMNEMAMGLHHMGINTGEVVRAMDTKWNALGFRPGLVGGHCIGVDPYYFVYEAERVGFHSTLIAAARRVNDDLPSIVAGEIVKQLVLSRKNPADCKIVMLGMTFKGNCPDLRNTKSQDVRAGLEAYGLRVDISDAVADPGEMEQLFQQEPLALEEITGADCLIFAADHNCYRRLRPEQLRAMMKEDGARLVVDIRNLFDPHEVEAIGCRYWSL